MEFSDENKNNESELEILYLFEDMIMELLKSVEITELSHIL